MAAQSPRPEIVADVTMIWAALSGAVRDPATGRYPERQGDDPALHVARYLKTVAVKFAAANDLGGFVTTSDSSPEVVERLRAAGARGVVTLDVPESVARQRLAVDGVVSPACDLALARWYR